MTHDDLVAVLLLLGVGAVDVAAEGSLDASPVFVILLEYGTEVEIRPDCVIRPIRSQCPMHGNGGTVSFQNESDSGTSFWKFFLRVTPVAVR